MVQDRLGPRYNRAPRRPFGAPFVVPTEALAAGPWEDIAFSRLGVVAASVSFQNIPSAFVMFRLYMEVINDANGKLIQFRFNNDSGANYAEEELVGNGATVSAAHNSAQTDSSPYFGLSANEYGSATLVIAKPIAGAAGLVVQQHTYTDGGGIGAGAGAGIWNNTTDLINRIDVLSSAGNFAAGSLFILQGSRF